MVRAHLNENAVSDDGSDFVVPYPVVAGPALVDQDSVTRASAVQRRRISNDVPVDEHLVRVLQLDSEAFELLDE